jgi:SanA protein
MNKIKKISRTLFHIVIFMPIIGSLRMSMLITGNAKTYLKEEVPQAPVALVLGAGLNRDGSPGVVLQDRVRKASELYFSGKVEKILMSGDNSEAYYNEPGAMQDFAISLGVPASDIVIDYAGRRTYDSCYRARAIFGLDNLIVVTQAFHLPRALFLCNAFDIDASGVPADEANYRLRYYSFWWVREIFASANAYLDVFFLKPEPILGKFEPIFP